MMQIIQILFTGIYNYVITDGADEMIFRCPGNVAQTTPTIKIKKCPHCGAEVEIFSTDMKVDCPVCGHSVFNNVNSCAEYCQYAEQCLGADTYQKLKKQPEQLKGG
jgi:DNA-directed RNA polymerase subunit RPC12/RpoP